MGKGIILTLVKRRGHLGWFLAGCVVLGFVAWSLLRAWSSLGSPPPFAGSTESFLASATPWVLACLTVFQVADALIDRRLRVPENWLSTADLIRRDIEKSLMHLDVPGEVSRCTIKVWAVVRPRRGRTPSTALPLTRQWVHSQMPARASHVEWAVGKGVIGQAVEQQKRLAANIGEHWTSVWNVSQEEWSGLSSSQTFGVTYKEFRQLRGDQPSDSPFVLAIPIRQKNEVVGVAALDTPSYMAQAVRNAEDTEHYLTILGNLVLGGDDLAGSVSAQQHA